MCLGKKSVIKDYAILGAFYSATNIFGTGQKANPAHSLQPQV